jgi:hypothetical protein
MPTTPSLAQTQHISSSKLFPGVFNKWFEMWQTMYWKSHSITIMFKIVFSISLL